MTAQHFPETRISIDRQTIHNELDRATSRPADPNLTETIIHHPAHRYGTFPVARVVRSKPKCVIKKTGCNDYK